MRLLMLMSCDVTVAFAAEECIYVYSCLCVKPENQTGPSANVLLQPQISKMWITVNVPRPFICRQTGNWISAILNYVSAFEG